jgi:hypothetical protein
MVNLIGQLLTLLFMVGGIIVSALALADPVRRIAIGVFSILGIANLVLIIVTYENTPDVPHFSDLVVVSAMAAANARNNFINLVGNHSLQLIAAVAAGMALGFFGPREYRKRKQRRWLSSYDIFRLTDPQLVKATEVAEEEVEKLTERILALQQERSDLGLQPNGSIDIDSAALEILSANVREAHAKNAAAHEIRERARRSALAGIYEDLREGKLIAKGFKDPLGMYPTEIEIPAAYWKFLNFSGDYKEAQGKGIKYTAIEIARK